MVPKEKHMRASPILGVVLMLAVAFPALAKKKESLKSAPGGASLKWSCTQLAEEACTLAKRCDPDKSKRRCRVVRERCSTVKEEQARHATEDDVNLCVQAMEDVSCKSAKFDNEQGVSIDFKKIELCGQVAADNLFPLRAGTSPSATEGKSSKGDKGDKDSKPAKDTGGEDE
jgi:hypothetical protein